MYFVYILHSHTAQRFYCGHTDNLERRLRQHNDPDYFGTRTTKVFPGPWELVWSQACDSRSEAQKRELAIKKRGIKRFLDK
ncbi:MAG: GIY-YIG nuclease family protein [Desulfobacterales bacterium]